MLRIAIPIQQPRMRFYVDGKPLVGGKVYSYSLGTELFKPTFRSASKTALNQNPVVLDEAGSALIYMTGSHLLKVFDKNGNFIEIRYLPMTGLRAYFYDMYGKPLKRGKVWTYDIASTIKKKSYSNPDKSESNINPVILDDAGSAIICMVGAYRLRVLDVNDVHQGDQDFQREITYALTSKPYPLYFDEAVTAFFQMNASGNKAVMNNASFNETVNTSFSMISGTQSSILNVTNVVEQVFTSFSILSALQRSAINVSSIVEQVSTSFSINEVRQRGILITNTAEIEKLNLNFSIKAAQFTN